MVVVGRTGAHNDGSISYVVICIVAASEEAGLKARRRVTYGTRTITTNRILKFTRSDARSLRHVHVAGSDKETRLGLSWRQPVAARGPARLRLVRYRLLKLVQVGITQPASSSNLLESADLNVHLVDLVDLLLHVMTDLVALLQ